MATIKNEIDKYLQTQSPRVLPVTLGSNINIGWSNVESKPTDVEIYNDLAKINVNLVPGLLNWTNVGTNYIYTDSSNSVDKTALVIPAASTDLSQMIISTALAQKIYPGTYTLSFKAYSKGADRIVNVDLHPDTLPESTFTITSTLTDFQVEWTSAHADMNGTVWLRFWCTSTGAQIEIGDIKLEPSTVRTPWIPNVLDLIGVNNQITPTNYQTYMAASSISSLAFSQNSGSTAGTGTHVDTSITFDSKGEKVLLQFVGQLTVAGLATYGVSYIEIVIKQNGTTVYTGGTLGAPNVAGVTPTILSFTDFLYIPAPGTGSNTFLMELHYTNMGDGMSGAGFKPSLQIIGLNR